MGPCFMYSNRVYYSLQHFLKLIFKLFKMFIDHFEMLCIPGIVSLTIHIIMILMVYNYCIIIF
jgi:hypothetical protein